MTAPFEIGGSSSPEEHLKKMKKLLKKQEDETLRGHIRQLSKAWGIKIRLPKAA